MIGMNRDKYNRTEEHVDSEGSWAISYGDMVTLLLAFFVLFFTIDPHKQAEESLQQSLLVELQNASNLNKGMQPKLLHIGQIKGKNIDQSVVQDLGAKVHKVGERILVDFPQVSFFEIGFIELNPLGKEALKKFVTAYLPFAGHYKLGIRAYTDSRPVVTRSVRFKNNLELSALRSVSTMRFLRDSGIPLSNMRLGGFGELRMTRNQLLKLADGQKTKDLRAFTRKVVLVIEPLEKIIEVSEGGKSS